jgi:hypothetical protein
MVVRAAAMSACRVSATLPWSRNAATVAGGAVLTVSGPISSAMYRTSEYALFLVPVDAQSMRCGRAPAAARAFQRGEAIIGA